MAILFSDWLRHFRLLRNCWSEYNEISQGARSQRPLPSLCFPGWFEYQGGCPGLLLAETLSTSSPQLLIRIQRNFQCLLPSLCFSGWSENQDWRLGLWLAETFLTSSMQLLIKIQWNFLGSKISTSSTKFVFLRLIGKPRLPPLTSWDIFYFFSTTAEQNSMKLYREQDLCVVYQVCVFQADQNTMITNLWYIFNFSATTEQNLRKLHRLQHLNV